VIGCVAVDVGNGGVELGRFVADFVGVFRCGVGDGRVGEGEG
jgi:hypothetical protein